MPTNASFQKILLDLDELLIESIQRALKQDRRGKEIPAEEVPKLLKGWIREAKRKKRMHR